MHELVIIDDDRQFSIAFTSFLKKQKGTSVKARTIVNVEKARQFILMRFPDVIIINAEIENRGGFDIMRECKRVNSPAKFIVVSDKKDFDILHEALRLGASDFFCKTC